MQLPYEAQRTFSAAIVQFQRKKIYDLILDIDSIVQLPIIISAIHVKHTRHRSIHSNAIIQSFDFDICESICNNANFSHIFTSSIDALLRWDSSIHTINRVYSKSNRIFSRQKFLKICSPRSFYHDLINIQRIRNTRI